MFPARNAQGKGCTYPSNKGNGCFTWEDELVFHSEKYSGWTAPQLGKQRVMHCLGTQGGKQGYYHN